MQSLHEISSLKDYDKFKAMLINRQTIIDYTIRYGKHDTAKLLGYDYSAFCLWIKHTEPTRDIND